MGIFTWLGGDIGHGNDWSSGGSTGIEPGPTDTANFSAGGTVSGAANVEIANFSGAYVFSGANLSAGQETVFFGGSIVQKDGINAIVGFDTALAVFGSYTLSGGALIDLVGHYVTSNFHITSGAGGNVAIFDPPTTAPPASTVHSANLALFANYLAASFPAVGHHGGGIIADLPQAGGELVLTHPGR